MRIDWKSRRGLYLAAAILAVVILLFILMVTFKPTPDYKQAANKPRPVYAQKIIVGENKPQVKLYGVVESTRLAKQRAKFAGNVAEVLVKEGQMVKKGQVLLRLSVTKKKLIVDQRKAEVLKIEGEIKVERQQNLTDQLALGHERKMAAVSEREFERMKKLVKNNYVSRTQLDKTDAEHAKMMLNITKRKHSLENHAHRLLQLEAQLKQARAMEGLAQVDLNDTKFIAPFDGKVNEVYVSEGGRVEPGNPVVEVLSLTGYRIRATLPNKYVSQVNEALAHDSSIEARAEWQNRWVTVALRALSSQVDEGQVTKDALFTIPGKKGYVALGQTVVVYLPLLSIKDTASLPLSALHGNNRIYEIIDGHLVATKVKPVGDIFKRDGTHMILVQSKDLKSGDLVLTSELPEAITGLAVSVRQ
ncbi:MAG: HlyD family efflux transporter periplasmic adaptor subunit [Coxiellaceae bacterium]|nr:HlyD family efflux transporter periplasmic adaptor subunit [Coxiellaceae bacterium]